MPLFDGLNIPAVEWCSIAQAILWIEVRKVPLNRFHESLLPCEADRAQVSRDESGKKRLILQASNGRVRLRGRPSRGPIEIVFDGRQRPRRAKCHRWGAIETIAPGKVEEAGLSGLLDDKSGLIGNDDSLASHWAYADVEVDFRQLMARYPAPTGENVLIGGHPVPVGPAVLMLGRAAPPRTALPPPRLMLPPPGSRPSVAKP